MIGILSALRKRTRISKERASLESMPDYLLKDIGIGRSEIYYMTRSGRGDYRLKD